MWQVTFDRWQVTRDTWHVKHDTWHMTHDTWHMTHSVGWTFSHNFSSLALPVWDWQCFEYISTNHESVSQSVNHEAVYRTAPWLINSLINKLSQRWLMEIYSKHCQSKTGRARQLTFWENVHLTLCVMCHVSCVMCHVSPVTCHMSNKFF